MNSYHMNSYPLQADLNSQINEQQNAAKKKLKKAQLSYMSPENYQKH